MQGPLPINFKLSATGESLTLLNTALQLEDEIIFGEQDIDQALARVPNGTGNFVIQAATFGYNNEQASGTGEPEDLQSELQMLPNPADQSVQIVLPVRTDQQLVEVFNVFGQRIVALPYQDGLTVAKKDWPAGAYVVRCGLVRRILVVRH